VSEELDELIEMARTIRMTPEQAERQRRSFAYGNSGACGTTEVMPCPKSSRARAPAPQWNAHCTEIGAKTGFWRNLVKPPEGAKSPQVVVRKANIMLKSWRVYPVRLAIIEV
jgi:hypothetical protein